MQFPLLLSWSLLAAVAHGLQCYSSTCTNGAAICIETCSGGNSACLASYTSIAGRLSVTYVGCSVGARIHAECHAARCIFNTIQSFFHSCCCDHDKCNAIDGITGLSPPTAPTPSVSPPPSPPAGQQICEMYSAICNVGSCVHGYQFCQGVCTAKYRKDMRENYRLVELGCLQQSNSSSSCNLDTSRSGPLEVNCSCGSGLCNSIRNLNFSNPINVVEYVDTACEALGCDHACVTLTGGGTRCLCQSGYAVASDERSCIDIDECALGLDNCAETCRNEVGTFSCGCSGIKILNADGRTCRTTQLSCPQNINCARNNVSCQRIIDCAKELIGVDLPHHCTAFFIEVGDNRIELQIAGCFGSASSCGTNTCPLTLLQPVSVPRVYGCCCTESQCSLNITFNGRRIETSNLTLTPMNGTNGTGVLPTINLGGYTFSPSDTPIMATTLAGITVQGGPQLSHGNIGLVVTVIFMVILLALVIMGLVILYCWCQKKRKRPDWGPERYTYRTSQENLCTGLDPGTVTKSDKPVGMGRFGDVFRGQSSDPNYSMELAIKEFKPNAKESWTREMKIYSMDGFRDPNVLVYLGSKEEGQIRWIITEFHLRGSLTFFLRHNVLTVDQCFSLTINFIKGLQFLHHGPNKNTVSHRDLKSSNILVKDNLMDCCISDFGLAIILPIDSDDSSATGQVGTPRYMAPEILDGAINLTPLAYLQIDIYAAALIMWEILSRTSPGQHVMVPEYSPPYGDFFPMPPSIDSMREFFKERPKERPATPDHFLTSDVCINTITAMQEAWCEEPGARVTACYIFNRLTTDSYDSGKGSLSPARPSHQQQPSLALQPEELPLSGEEDNNSRTKLVTTV